MENIIVSEKGGNGPHIVYKNAELLQQVPVNPGNFHKQSIENRPANNEN